LYQKKTLKIRYGKVRALFTTARDIGPETGIVEKSPVYCTGTHFYQICAWSCPGTHFSHFYHGQSEVALKDGRAQEQCFEQ